MIQAAPKAMTAGQGSHYYETEYSAGDYYLKDTKDVRGVWSGKGAEDLGLRGRVDQGDFAAVLEGKTRANGNQIIPDPPTGEHRAAWDFTCSPDKSISIMALVAGDERIIRWAEAANAKAMQELELFSMAKDTDRAFETTGNLTIATFKHDTSRKLDPQLHFHNVVMNMTRRMDRKWVALETGEMYAAQAYLTAVFRSEMARDLQAGGYEIEVAKDGNVSIKGVSKALCDEFSKRRRKDIEPYLEMHGRTGAAFAQKAAHSTRTAKQKNVNEVALRGAWREVTQELGENLNEVWTQADDRVWGAAPEAPGIREVQAQESLRHAMDHLSERKATFQGRELYTEALKHGMGKVDLDGIRGQAKGEKDLIRVKERNIPSGRMTTTQALSLERANVRLMREGRDAGEAILQGKPFNPGKFLTPGQGKVAEHILTSRDQVLAVEGKAGAGKTYTLEAVVSTAKAEGWEVRGFAPTNKAAASLREAGLSTKTIAALGLEKGPGGRGRQLWIVDEAGLMSSRGAEIVLRKAQEVGVKVVFVGDRRQHAAVEAGQPFGYLQGAGLVAVKLDEIQRQARPAEAIHAAAGAAQEGRWKEAARILEGQWKTPLSKLWGKSMPELERAAQAIKEGRHEEALEILETRSMQARALESSVRHASEGRMQDSVSALDGAGKILEIPNRAGRHRAVAEDYLSTPKGQTCIIIAPSNDERCQLNHEVREARIRGGEIDKNSIKIEVRVSKGLTRPQRKELRNYEPGDYIRFGTGSGVYDIERGAEGRVVAVDPERNLVRVELTSGRTAEFNPGRYYGGELGDLAQIETRRLVEGDRIQYRETTRRDGTRVKTGRLKIINGDVGIVKSLNRETGRALVQLEGSADPIALDLTRPQPIDHAYAMTSHLSQSGTYDRSLVVIDTEHSRELVNQAQFYVSVSRAALESKVYTSNRADLVQKVCRQAGKSSALELVQRKAVSSPVPEQVMTAAVGFGGESPLSRGSNEPKRDPRRDVWGRPIPPPPPPVKIISQEEREYKESMALTPEERREKPLVEYGVSPLPATVPPPVLTGKGQFDESYREFESAVIDSAIKDRKHSPGEELAVGRLEQEKAMKQRNHPQYVSPEHLKLSTSTLVDMEKVDRRLEVAGLPPQFTPAQTRVANAENIEAGLEKARKGGLMVAGSSWASLPQETIKRTAEDIASQLPLGHRVSLHKNQWRGLGG